MIVVQSTYHVSVFIRLFFAIVCFLEGLSTLWDFVMKGGASSQVFVFEVRFSLNPAGYTDCPPVTVSELMMIVCAASTLGTVTQCKICKEASNLF